MNDPVLRMLPYILAALTSHNINKLNCHAAWLCFFPFPPTLHTKEGGKRVKERIIDAATPRRTRRCRRPHRMRMKSAEKRSDRQLKEKHEFVGHTGSSTLPTITVTGSISAPDHHHQPDVYYGLDHRLIKYYIKSCVLCCCTSSHYEQAIGHLERLPEAGVRLPVS